VESLRQLQTQAAFIKIIQFLFGYNKTTITFVIANIGTEQFKKF